jgi:hypothetical protein
MVLACFGADEEPQGGVSRTPHLNARRRMIFYLNMRKHSEPLGKFVRLNQTGKIVDRLVSDTTDITVNREGKPPTMAYYEASRISVEKGAAGKPMSA